MTQPGDDSGEEGEHSGSLRSAPFLLTPHTQAQFGKMNEDFDSMLQRNQILLPVAVRTSPLYHH
ncbi:hypothetical protein GBAR_LOCUS19572 [Geodia barretti]|uniref:Uncharacterized protein n=1 Tax=Geodia barretti TaxID=519541 RepID=A0AA35STR7_GEOBA|nr:hypothetical protein GBAR_LOCUS19572 [Geodia barretti]